MFFQLKCNSCTDLESSLGSDENMFSSELTNDPMVIVDTSMKLKYNYIHNI